MKLKPLLRGQITATIKSLREKVAANEEALAALQKVNTKKAKYTVYLHSAWANHGEKSTTTQNFGSLEDSIKKAEKEFKEVNSRSDVQADYKVHIEVGREHYFVPQDFWKDYQEKRV